MEHAHSKKWQGLGPISPIHPTSLIPLLHRRLPDRFCLINHPAVQTSCPSKQCQQDWAESLLLLASPEDSGFRPRAPSETFSAQESRLGTHWSVSLVSGPFATYLCNGQTWKAVSLRHAMLRNVQYYPPRSSVT